MKKASSGGDRIRVVVFLAVIPAVALLICASIFVMMRLGGERVRHRLERMLCDTDYRSLLAACRQVSEQVSNGNLKSGRYPIRTRPAGETPELPRVILDLEPTYIEIDEHGSVMVELHGGMLHIGVIGYPEDFNPPYLGYEYGDKELIPGLWYYDDGYRDSSRHREEIDAMVEKGRSLMETAH